MTYRVRRIRVSNPVSVPCSRRNARGTGRGSGAGLTPQQKRWVSATLANDETSSDGELVDYFESNGLTRAQANAAVAQRDKFLTDVHATLNPHPGVGRSGPIKKYRTRRRVGKALKKYVRGRKNPGRKNPNKRYEVTVPSKRGVAGYKLTISARTKTQAKSEARKYCVKRAKAQGVSGYTLPATTKVREVKG